MPENTIKLPWSEFKSMYRTKRIPIQMFETENAYELSMPEHTNCWHCYIFKETDPRHDPVVYADWDQNYRQVMNLPVDLRSEDGRMMIQPVTLDKGIWHWFCGAGDDPVNGKAEGTQFSVRISTPNTPSTVSWGFNDWIVLAGGVAKYRGANIGDYCDFRLHVPASNAVPNESNTGNCNKVPTGYGFNLIVPAAGDGAFDLDLANDANPVPEENKQGFWDWTWPPTGKGTFLPMPGQGHYNLFDVDIPVIRFIAKAPLLGEDRLEFQPQNVHPTYILPHWRMECTVTHGPSEETLEMVWWMYAARKITV